VTDPHLRRSRGRPDRVVAWAASVFLGLGLSIVVAGPVSASSERDGEVGYVRLAHLSPDTPKLDVYLSKVGDRSFKRERFPEVRYGVMSSYLQLAVGTYAVSMRPAGAPESDPPVLMTQVTVEDGAAYTVAGVGHFANLRLKVLTDDLSRPPPDRVKVRIIQASIGAPVLDVTLPDGTAIAKDVQFATTTPYQLLNPGTLKLRLKPNGSASAKEVSAALRRGNIYSLLVLDGAGSLTAQLMRDAQGFGKVPDGGVETGAGGAASGLNKLAIVGFGLAALLALVAIALRLRRLAGQLS
jgi:Domain of unknown function (DUF4397)